MSVGFRVFTKRILPPKDLVEAFREIPASNISDCMGRLSGLGSEIRLMTQLTKENMVGIALTVKARPGDNLMLHKAIDMAGPGDIIVVSNEGDRSQSLMGAIMASIAKSRGVSGFVLDGPIRDIEFIYSLGIPIYATGTTPAGPWKEGPGEINVPISCGRNVINPGDIVLGDRDGVIVIPQNDAKALLEIARTFKSKDEEKLTVALNGSPNREWVDKMLADKGCEIIEEAYVKIFKH